MQECSKTPRVPVSHSTRLSQATQYCTLSPFLRERCSKHLPKPDPTAEVFRSFCPNCKPLLLSRAAPSTPTVERAAVISRCGGLL